MGVFKKINDIKEETSLIYAWVFNEKDYYINQIQKYNDEIRLLEKKNEELKLELAELKKTQNEPKKAVRKSAKKTTKEDKAGSK